MADGIQLAKAFVQIVPTTKGIQNNIGEALNEGDPGKEAGSKIGASLKKAVAAIGIGTAVTKGLQTSVATIKQSVEAYSEFEQLAGGTEKIFESMDTSKIFADANQAYKTLGLSASEYLDTVNTVGASFVSSMGAEKAYETAKTGLAAISDFASGTGKDLDTLKEKFGMITRSTASYQSIADQFSGILPQTTQGFLEQAQASGLLSESYENLTDVPVDEYQQAVSAMLAQGVEQLNFTNNTAKEATTTISGSLGMLKASWQNMLLAMSDGSQDFDAALDGLTSSIGAVLSNLLPVVGNAVSGLVRTISGALPQIAAQLPSFVSGILDNIIPALGELVGTLPATLIQAIADLLPELIPLAASLVETIATTLIHSLPMIVESSLELVRGLGDGIIAAIPILVGMLPELIFSIVNFILGDLPTFITTAIEIVVALANGIVGAIPQIAAVLPDLIDALVTGILENLPLFITSGIDIIIALIDGIVSMLPEILYQGGIAILQFIQGLVDNIAKLPEKGREMIDSVKEGIKEKISDALTWGKDLIGNFIAGLKQKWENLKQSVRDIAGSIKNILGFSEPKEGPLSNFHTYAPDMMQLFEKGVIDYAPQLKQTVATAFDFEPVIASATYTPPSYSDNVTVYTPTASMSAIEETDERLVNAFRDALEDMTVVMDDKEMGRFVKKTIKKAVYG